jgi:NADPH-dependent 2,4-dienoyl-CoA reductase/sulfur reductase-like enzyme
VRTVSVDAAVIGAGSAGMAAALSLRRAGRSVALLEREPFLGGILQQCIHPGFGLHRFGEDLTGPEYAERFAAPVRESGMPVFLDSTVMEIARADGGHRLHVLSGRHGAFALEARAVVLAMGCRERNRGNVAIAGTRPAGVFTAGLAQRLVNIEGYLPGRRVVVVGSGDIGLIMARRLTLVGCEVLGVVEIQPWPSGIVRNIVQCLNDFGIPLHLGHVVTRIEGRHRVEGVEIAPLAEGRPDLSRAFRLACDTVLLSVGLVPENELSVAAGVAINGATGGPFVGADLQTGVPGVFACGNVLHVHDLVDFVSEEAERCGAAAAAYLAGAGTDAAAAGPRVVPGANIRYVGPNAWQPGRENVLYCRPLVVKNGAVLAVRVDGREVRRRKLAHVQPSEMIRVGLEPAELPAIEPGQPNVLEVSLA